MDNREQDFLDRIKSESEQINIPESLNPDKMEQKLSETSKPVRWNKYWSICAAACFILVCGLVYGLPLEKGGMVKDKSGSTSADKQQAADDIESAGSYDDIYAYIEKSWGQYETGAAEQNSGSAKSDSAAMISEDAGAANAAGARTESSKQVADGYASSSHSDTNVRQEGVDEADIVKTDGRYIYTLTDNGQSVSIVDTQDGLKCAGEIKSGDNGEIQEFYVKDNKLMTVSSDYASVEGSTYNLPSTDRTKVTAYDITDKKNPEKTGEMTQSGYYTSSRMEGDYLYLFTQYSVNYGAARNNPESFVPAVNGKILANDSIYLPPYEKAQMYEVITSIDINEPGQPKDSRAVFSNGGDLYVSGNNIYWYEQNYGDGTWAESVSTVIRKLSYKDGAIEPEAEGKVSGYINDSFSIDEYKGYLRVVTTAGDLNHVFVLDKDLKTAGSIKNLAKDERVYSARLLGEWGYFVTYKETDPLFSVDFSDPQNPEIAGELKIPGFSQYLHFYGEDLLLGIGMDTDEASGSTGGVKLSMFDISDRKEVTETNKYVMENVYSADVFYDYRAVLIDEDKNIIGLSVSEGGNEKYCVFSYNREEGFRLLMEETINGSGYQTARGLYIGNVLYVVKGNIIEAYSMEDYRKTEDIII